MMAWNAFIRSGILHFRNNLRDWKKSRRQLQVAVAGNVSIVHFQFKPLIAHNITDF